MRLITQCDILETFSLIKKLYLLKGLSTSCIGNCKRVLTVRTNNYDKTKPNDKFELRCLILVVIIFCFTMFFTCNHRGVVQI